MNIIHHTIKIATLNCRGLKKSENSTKRQQFIRYLKALGYDILVLQETHASDISTQELLINHFSCKSSLWTQHCGIVSLSTKFTLQNISDGIDGGRYILAHIYLTQDLETTTTIPPIATILNIYGRSDLHSARSAFYSELLDGPIVKDTITNSNNNPIFIMGDFNYQYKDRRMDGSLICAPPSWTQLLEDRYIDIFGEEKLAT